LTGFTEINANMIPPVETTWSSVCLPTCFKSRGMAALQKFEVRIKLTNSSRG